MGLEVPVPNSHRAQLQDALFVSVVEEGVSLRLRSLR